jgi:uncharacterized protein YodC (DUF2158 family)
MEDIKKDEPYVIVAERSEMFSINMYSGTHKKGDIVYIDSIGNNCFTTTQDKDWTGSLMLSKYVEPLTNFCKYWEDALPSDPCSMLCIETPESVDWLSDMEEYMVQVDDYDRKYIVDDWGDTVYYDSCHLWVPLYNYGSVFPSDTTSEDSHAEPTGFSVGDVVVAKEDTPYYVTDNGWEGVIKGVSCDDITVRGDAGRGFYMGFNVKPEYFNKKEEVEPSEDSHAEPTGFSVGDVVVAKEDTPYYVTTNGWEGVIKWVFRYSIMVRDLDDDLIYLVDPEYFYKKEEVRPTPETLRTFGELSDEEKGALLLAAHEGKPLQYYSLMCGVWFNTDDPIFFDDFLYRITPNKVLEAREEKDRLESLVRNLEESLADTKDNLKDVSQTLRELNAV